MGWVTREDRWINQNVYGLVVVLVKELVLLDIFFFFICLFTEWSINHSLVYIYIYVFVHLSGVMWGESAEWKKNDPTLNNY